MNEPKTQKKASSLSVTATVHTEELLNKPHICKDIARAYPSLKEVLVQIQLDSTTDDNRDTVGPTLLAMKKIMDMLFVFKTKGDVYIEQENKKDAKR